MLEKIIKFFLPDFIWEKIEKNPELKKILANINWLFFDKAVQMAAAFFVGVWVIRYLGPERYGMLSYAIAFVALFGFIASLGMDEIAVREFVKYPEKRKEIFGTLFFLRLIAGIAAFICSIMAVILVKSGNALIFWLAFIISLSFIFQVSNVFDFWFQSQVASKYAAYIRSGVGVISGLTKIIMILMNAPLIAFAWVILFESVLTLFGFVFVFLKKKEKISICKINLSIGKRILSNSWPLILSSAMVVVYMKIDQVMIGNMLSDKLLGIYSAAVSLSEMWYFFPVIVVSSVFPAIIYAKKLREDLYIKRLKLLYAFMIWASVIFAIPISLFSKNIINFLYGQQYSLAAPVLAIYVWAGVAVALGVANGKFLIIENLTKISFCTAAIGAIANIVLNLILIPIYGITGAAIATLISYFVAVLSSGFFKKSRINLLLFIKAMNIYEIYKENVNSIKSKIV